MEDKGVKFVPYHGKGLWNFISATMVGKFIEEFFGIWMYILKPERKPAGIGAVDFRWVGDVWRIFSNCQGLYEAHIILDSMMTWASFQESGFR